MIDAPVRTHHDAAHARLMEEDQQRTLAEHVNSLLAQWHAWCLGDKVGIGISSAAAGFLQSVPSRQYDDENGALDAHIDIVLMQAVDSVIDGIAEPWKSALSIQARNLYTGRQVWNSPRLPSCSMQRAEVVVAARKKFIDSLQRRKLL